MRIGTSKSWVMSGRLGGIKKIRAEDVVRVEVTDGCVPNS